jgi:hypothetical protein
MMMNNVVSPSTPGAMMGVGGDASPSDIPVNHIVTCTNAIRLFPIIPSMHVIQATVPYEGDARMIMETGRDHYQADLRAIQFNHWRTIAESVLPPSFLSKYFISFAFSRNLSSKDSFFLRIYLFVCLDPVSSVFRTIESAIAKTLPQDARKEFSLFGRERVLTIFFFLRFFRNFICIG